jgi:hypothetical protein
MIKKILATSLVVSSLIFSGCGGNSEGEDALATQQMLDNGDFIGVIAKLESRASSPSDYLTLAAAYMGKAGFSISSIIGTVAASADSTDSSAFSKYIESSKNKSNSKSLNDLDTAVSWYQKVISQKCSNKDANLTGAESDICLYVGLSKVSQTAVAIGYIADDVSVLTDGNTQTDNKLTASTCAMQYANGSLDPKCTAVIKDNNLTFTNHRSYEEVTFTVNGEAFDSLITFATPKSTAITNGFCKIDFSGQVSTNPNDPAFHVCPVNQSSDPVAKDMTTEEIIVKALNEGTDSVGVAVSDDVKKDIDKFKQDLIKLRTPADANTTIVVQDVINYLNDKNQ